MMANPAGRLVKWSILAVLLLGLLAALTVANLQFSRISPGGTDFLVHWVGARGFLEEGRSPYSEETAIEIQTWAYGRPARAGEHELRVAYPFYSLLLFSPFALVKDYPLARALWMTALEAGLVLLVVASLKAVHWNPSPVMLGGLLIFTLLWYHGVRPLINGNAVVLIALSLTAGLVAIRFNRDAAAGVLFALATIKPQLAILPVGFVLLWSVSCRRWTVVTWLLGSLAALFLGGMLFLPNWPLQNLAEILRYPGYNPPGTPGAAFSEWWPGIGRTLAWGWSIGMAGLLMWIWRTAWRKPYPYFLWAALFTLVISQWIGIQTDPGNFILLFPALIWILAGLGERYPRSSGLRIGMTLAILGIGMWALFLLTLGEGVSPQQHAIMFFPLPLALLIGLLQFRPGSAHIELPES